MWKPPILYYSMCHSMIQVQFTGFYLLRVLAWNMPLLIQRLQKILSSTFWLLLTLKRQIISEHFFYGLLGITEEKKMSWGRPQYCCQGGEIVTQLCANRSGFTVIQHLQLTETSHRNTVVDSIKLRGHQTSVELHCFYLLQKNIWYSHLQTQARVKIMSFENICI